MVTASIFGANAATSYPNGSWSNPKGRGATDLALLSPLLPQPTKGATSMPALTVPANLMNVRFFMKQRCVFHFKVCKLRTMLLHEPPLNTVDSRD